MKTIIIPDIHNHHHWVEEFLAEMEYDRVVFLGDYFDDFHDTLDDVTLTAKWLRESLYKRDRVHLTGNHDMPYRFPDTEDLRCSGFTEEKAQCINEVMLAGDNHWDRLNTVYYQAEGNWLLSHAGVNAGMMNPLKDDLDLDHLEAQVKTAIANRGHGSMYGAGGARGGRHPVGGVTWRDWDDEFEIVEGVNQVVGHTPHEHPVVKALYSGDTPARTYLLKKGVDWRRYKEAFYQEYKDELHLSLNLDLDTNGRHWATIEDGVIDVHENLHENTGKTLHPWLQPYS